ncbi:hypothetical protein QEJ31_03075 [Pigmentibacter sp. JX0631]|uniref:hypothetical protein n=1 Tax=Pigmentibacter sp. JX0631 TaxID=2976982 RepID=UPI0024689714|nr:hypothetical protein [Pigmentibacter sp. JX0631]WGL60583.1 hypothetical protein QEJ31_03075 [Pigmentibacter sp. JX0631]
METKDTLILWSSYAKKKILQFFIEQQKKITNYQKHQLSIIDIRRKTEEYFNKNLIDTCFSLKIEQKINSSSSITIPNFISDEDFSKLFQTERNFNAINTSDDLFCLFTSPISLDWKEYLIHKSNNSLVFRTGFFTEEYEIYESIIHGFNGLILYCFSQDVYEIQLLTEIAREYKFTLIFLIHDKNQLFTVLESDAPYFAISGINSCNFKNNIQNLIKLISFIPSSAKKIAWINKLEKKEKQILQQVGYEIFFEIN